MSIKPVEQTLGDETNGGPDVQVLKPSKEVNFVRGAKSFEEIFRIERAEFVAQTYRIEEIFKALNASVPVEGMAAVDDDDAPTDAEWMEIKELALKSASDGLDPPATHLAEVRRRIALATTRNVE